MQALEGSLVALVTPLSENGEVDYAVLQKLLDWHVNEGTDGIVSVGTTGESATLNFKEHIEVVEFTVKHINGRLPVIAGTGANSTMIVLAGSGEHSYQDGMRLEHNSVHPTQNVICTLSGGTGTLLLKLHKVSGE